MKPPTLSDVYAARERISLHLRPTPLMSHPLLNEETGLDIWVKHENHNPTGAFKLRGGLNLVSSLTPDERARGLVTASTGNHGQSIALACQLERCERAAEATGARYVHSANEPLLIAGVATYALEIFEALPDADVILVPIGGGSGACGTITVKNGLGAPARVIGVGAAQADAVARSWRTGERIVGSSAATFAEGIATRVTFDLTFGILRQYLDDFVLVSEADLAAGVRLAVRATHNLAEGAGAAALAAASVYRERFQNLKVVAVMSGGNLHTERLRWILSTAST